jgi:hypothetical protein
MSGLDREDLELAIPFEERERERKEFFKQAEREYEAERRDILSRPEPGGYPVDYELLLERAERKFLKKLHTWEPKAIREKRRPRSS